MTILKESEDGEDKGFSQIKFLFSNDKVFSFQALALQTALLTTSIQRLIRAVMKLAVTKVIHHTRSSAAVFTQSDLSFFVIARFKQKSCVTFGHLIN